MRRCGTSATSNEQTRETVRGSVQVESRHTISETWMITSTRTRWVRRGVGGHELSKPRVDRPQVERGEDWAEDHRGAAARTRPRGDLEPPTRRHDRRHRVLPVEGLPARRSRADAHPRGGGIPSALPGCMSCRSASCASATSVSWPHAVARYARHPRSSPPHAISRAPDVSSPPDIERRGPHACSGARGPND